MLRRDELLIGKEIFSPWVGQAERLACHWQPNAFCGLAPEPTLDGPTAEGKRKKPGTAQP